MRFSRQIFLPLLAVGGLVVAACGDEDAVPFGASADTLASADSDEPTDTDAPSATDAPAETDAPSATEAPVDIEAPAETASSGDGSDFCDFVDRTRDTDDLLESIGGDPAELEAAMNELRDRVDELRDLVPSEIAGDADVFADAILKLVDALEAADYDILNADLAFLDDDQLDEVITAATERIDELTEKRCGVSLGISDDESSASDPVDDGDDASADDFSLDGGTVREQFIEQFVALGLTLVEATCITDKIDLTNATGIEDDLTEILALFEECGISLSRLAEIGG